MRSKVVHLNMRVPVALHRRLKAAAVRNKRSLHAEMLARLVDEAETVDRMLDRIEERARYLVEWATEAVERHHSEAVVVAVNQIVRRLREGDVPVLVNEELARVNREVLRDEVRAAMRSVAPNGGELT